MITEDIEAPHYLLDSNIVSEIVKREPEFNVIEKIAEHSSDCAIGSTTWHELLYGMYKLPEGLNRKFLEDYLFNDVQENFKVITYSKKAAKIHAKIRAEIEAIGKPAPFADSLIASIALANHMVLVTRNTKHLEAIQEVSGLEVENWFTR